MVGRAGYRQLIKRPRTAFPDFENTPQAELAAGDKVVVRWRAHGTHLAPLGELPATGRKIAVFGIDIFRLTDGMVAESWEEVDRLGMMQQLGVIPGAASAVAERGTVEAPRPQRDVQPASAAANIALLQRFYDVLNRGDVALVDSLVAKNATYNGQPLGPDGVQQHITATRAAFPDLAWSIEDIIADGDTVVTRYIYSGTHRGDLMGIPPSGKSFRATGIAIDRIADGLIVEEWEVRDTWGAMTQIGAIPSPGQLRT